MDSERDFPLPPNERSFLDAAKVGDLPVLSSLLAKGVPVDVLDNRESLHWDSWGQTALMHAAAGGHAEVVRFLLSKGAKVSAKDRGGWDSEYDCGPLHYATLSGDAATAGVLLEAAANPNAISHLGFSPLGLAVQHKNVAAMKRLIQQGADLNLQAKAKQYTPPVHVAVFSQDVAILRLLLEAGAHPDALNTRNETSLMYVASAPESVAVAMTKELLKAGANVNHVGNGSSPLFRAVVEANVPVARELLNAGADPSFIYESHQGTVRGVVEKRIQTHQKEPGPIFGVARLHQWEAMGELLDEFQGKRSA